MESNSSPAIRRKPTFNNQYSLPLTSFVYNQTSEQFLSANSQSKGSQHQLHQSNNHVSHPGAQQLFPDPHFYPSPGQQRRQPNLFGALLPERQPSNSFPPPNALTLQRNKSAPTQPLLQQQQLASPLSNPPSPFIGQQATFVANPFMLNPPYSPQSIASTWSPRTLAGTPPVGTRLSPQSSPWVPTAADQLQLPQRRRLSHQPMMLGKSPQSLWEGSSLGKASRGSLNCDTMSTLTSAPKSLIGVNGPGTNLLESCVEDDSVLMASNSPLAHTLECLGLDDDDDAAADAKTEDNAIFSSILLGGCDGDKLSPSVAHEEAPLQTLWIGNIDPSITETDLISAFTSFGQIELVRLMPEKDCAFIQFQNTGDAVVACREMQGARIGNCIVKIAHGKCDIGQMVVMGAAEGIVSRAIWVGNLSQSCKPAELKAMFEKYGSVESARVLPHKTCGFVNFFDIFAAIRAKSEFNSSQVYEHSVAAPIKIRYAKVFIDQPSPVSRSISVASDIGHFVDEEQFTNDAEYLRDFAKPPVNIPDPNKYSFATRIMPLKHLQNGMEAKPLHSTGTAFLRDLKKKFDSGEKLKDFDAAFNYLFPQIVDLSIDTLGNTVVQRFIERATVKQRKRIIEEYAAQLPAVGVHKNGTYVVQKILEHSVDCPEQVNMLVSTLLPYIILLMADPFGNYVVQGCLRLPYNQFVFEIMYTHCLSIGQLKFGARSMRACLESLHATKEQLQLVGHAVVKNAVALGKNPNGILLLHWLLDNSNLNGRFYVLARRLLDEAPLLSNLKQTHIVVLKIIGQHWEPQARRLFINRGIFRSAESLSATLFGAGDYGIFPSELGTAVIVKCLQVQCEISDFKTRSSMIQMIRFVIDKRLTADQQQDLASSSRGFNYKKLLEEMKATSAAEKRPSSITNSSWLH